MQVLKFRHFEKVRVLQSPETVGFGIDGLTGLVIGTPPLDEDWGSPVAIYSVYFDGRKVVGVSETDLESLGEFTTREEFYNHGSIRVGLDGKFLGKQIRPDLEQ